MSDQKIIVPDIGGATDVDVIEVFVSVGDTIAVDDALITLEGDKASMDIPSTAAGVVESVAVKVGDKISEGGLICTVKTSGEKAETKPAPKKEAAEKPVEQKPVPKPAAPLSPVETSTPVNTGNVHAGPAVRRLAQEVGVDLSKVAGTGEKSRITKEDLKKYVTGNIQAAASGGGGFSVLPQPMIDFSKFGEVESQPLSKIKKISGANLHRNWVSIPHVTQFEEADITEMESFRQANKDAAAKKGFKLTPLVFIMKAVVASLKEFPIFNASLDSSNEALVLKKYFHIGVAVDTPNGLVVPVIRDVDKKGIYELAKELSEVSVKARDTGLSMTDMQGGCFTISSLGGIGGTAFTPIINAPEVAILGVSKAAQKPHFQPNGAFEPRLMLPLSLSYDHRVIDGADGARFVVFLSQCLADIRTLLL